MSEIQSKKILCIVQLPPPLHGASVMNSLVINSKLINASFDIDVINLQFSKSHKELKKLSLRKVFITLSYFFKIVGRVSTFKPDLVYFTISPVGFGFYRDAFYVILLKILKTKIVFHLHGKGIKQNAQGSRLKRKLYRWVFKNASVICLSESLTQDISDIYTSRPFIVPNGIHEFKINGQKKNEDLGSVLRILFLSNFKRDKGVLTLIEALGILKEQGYNFSARLVGAPSDYNTESIEEIIRNKNLSEFIEVSGPAYGDRKNNEFMNADIFVFPSYNDAFPLVIIEAFQFALPVVSTYEGGIPDMVNNNESGFLVLSQNPQMLAEKIAILLKDNELRMMMGRKGYESYRNNYTIAHFENRLNGVFKEILIK
jgi:glycosyltransferase involved in cell wall biosynthesis